MTVNARSRLFGSLRAFFERYLRGLARWDSIEIDPSIPTERLPNGRRHPEGVYKEIVTIRFGDYGLTVESPNADPPLGWITLYAAGNVVVEGPLDQTTWEQAGNFIQKRGMRKSNGRRSETPDWLSAG